MEKNKRIAYSVKEAAKALGIGENAAYELVHKGDFPKVKVGKRYIIPVDSLNDWICRQAANSSDSI